jgi:hypothetical protein
MLRHYAASHRWLVTACAGWLLAALTGCSGGGWAKVSGRVTVNDKPVTSGRVTFVHDDGRSALAIIKSDGSYSAEKVPVGKLKVGIVGLDFAGYEKKIMVKRKDGKMQDPTNPDSPPPPETPKAGPPGAWVSPRYNDPKSSRLTADVKDGENKIDFPLQGV